MGRRLRGGFGVAIVGVVGAAVASDVVGVVRRRSRWKKDPAFWSGSPSSETEKRLGFWSGSPSSETTWLLVSSYRLDVMGRGPKPEYPLYLVPAAIDASCPFPRSLHLFAWSLRPLTLQKYKLPPDYQNRSISSSRDEISQKK